MTHLSPDGAWVYRCPKMGERLDASEDAFAVNPAEGLYAVADGASTAPYSGAWARLLARAFVQRPPPEFTVGALRGWLARPRRLWGQRIPWERLDYFARRNAERGSFSTLVGLRVETAATTAGDAGASPRVVRWQSIAVGDSCVFHIRGNRLVAAFPLSEPEQFQNAPFLLGTAPVLDHLLPHHLQVVKGEARTGDVLALSTDALAAYFVEHFRRAKKLVQRLTRGSRSNGQGPFREFVAQERAAGRLRNDDVTLVLIALH